MKTLFSRLRDGVFSWLYPGPCHVCGALVEAYDDGIACTKCWHEQKLFTTNLCARCGLPLASQLKPNSPAESGCLRCSDIAFSWARACGEYRGALRAQVLYLKHQPYLCGRLRRLLADTINRWPPIQSADVIIPVPLHPQREQERGYNQAALLARRVAAMTGRPLDRLSLQRVKATARHRAGMDEVERRRSVAQAFAVTRPARLEAKIVLLVDDVFTTGSTINECARALLAAGASEVRGLTLARVI